MFAASAVLTLQLQAAAPPGLPRGARQALRCQRRWLPSEEGTLLGPRSHVRWCSPCRTSLGRREGEQIGRRRDGALREVRQMCARKHTCSRGTSANTVTRTTMEDAIMSVTAPSLTSQPASLGQSTVLGGRHVQALGGTSGLQGRADLPHWGNVTPSTPHPTPGAIWQHLETFVVVLSRGALLACSRWRPEVLLTSFML